MERQRAVDDWARADSKVVWPIGSKTIRNAWVIVVAVVAVIAVISLMDLIFARGALHLFG